MLQVARAATAPDTGELTDKRQLEISHETALFAEEK